MTLRLALIISLIAGFVSISMEIVWFSILGYMFKGHAFTFGAVLSLVLFGIAFGAKYGYRAVNKPGVNVLQLISKYLLVGGLFNFAGFPVIAWLMTFSSAFAALLAINVVVVSGLLGCIFPLLCHLAVSQQEQSVGRQTSQLYAANIIGATTGPLITGYILYDLFSIEQIITGLCVVLLLLSFMLRMRSAGAAPKLKNAAVYVTLLVGVVLVHNLLYTHFLEHIQYQSIFDKTKVYKHLLHNRSGILAVDQQDRMFGSGAYDGAFNTDPSEYNINAVDRIYMVAAMHRQPESVLVIGLSTGSWAKVLANYDHVKQMTIIEINPGYLDIISKYPEIATLLTDKRVKIIIDDGRRWLKRNPDQKFDLIVMNTTYHWRQNSTNLLSYEFLGMAKNNLKPNGVMYWNTTKSQDVVYTAAHVFSHVTTYGTLVAASDSPFNLTEEERRSNFMKFRRFDEVLFTQEKFVNRGNQLINMPLPELHDSILKQDLWLITDNNMAAEYKADIWAIFKNITPVGAEKK
ncbi:MAG: fused MFS/spermidine synthase [Bacteroidia bacterium]|jgi:spermidine synthase|nr:fused MFS/spermidine synthase [Bacteroidia bacterium]